MDLRETYDHIAEDWHADHRDDDWWIDGAQHVVSLLQAGDCILDVGCGGGTKSQYFITKGLRVVGIDFSEKMIAIAKRDTPEGEFHVLDLYEAGLLGQTFDCVFMEAVLLHVPRANVDALVDSFVKMVNDSGYVYIAVKDKKLGKPDEEIKVEHDYGYPYERFFSYFTVDEIKASMEQAGLEIVFEHIVPSGHTRWIEVIGKKIST